MPRPTPCMKTTGELLVLAARVPGREVAESQGSWCSALPLPGVLSGASNGLGGMLSSCSSEITVCSSAFLLHAMSLSYIRICTGAAAGHISTQAGLPMQ